MHAVLLRPAFVLLTHCTTSASLCAANMTPESANLWISIRNLYWHVACALLLFNSSLRCAQSQTPYAHTPCNICWHLPLEIYVWGKLVCHWTTPWSIATWLTYIIRSVTSKQNKKRSNIIFLDWLTNQSRKIKNLTLLIMCMHVRVRVCAAVCACHTNTQNVCVCVVCAHMCVCGTHCTNTSKSCAAVCVCVRYMFVCVYVCVCALARACMYCSDSDLCMKFIGNCWTAWNHSNPTL